MHNYFKPYKNYFWEWQAANSEAPSYTNYVSAIPNGQTIAYFDSILNDLEDLVIQGIPPFGSFLLVLIASSNTIQDATFSKFKTDLITEHGQSNKTITNAIIILDYIWDLPEHYKTGENKTQLFQNLFKNCHNRLSKNKSRLLLDNTRKGHSHYMIHQTREAVTYKTVEEDFRIIALLVRRFKSPQDIINTINNVPVNNELLETITIEKRLSPEVETNKNLVDQLIEHKDTYQIGSLIKRIWSGLNIPMHNSLPSNQPLGGVSDITNKGDFSRLLISEFAHDDDTFMSRIANNEALYIERETPPEHNTKERIFLIDASLKNWGIPKLLSFATAIAIATHPKSDFSYRVYSIGDHYKEAFIGSTLQVIESQHFLSGTLHCANGLQSFLDEHTEINAQEVFLLTEEDSLNNSSLQNVIYTNYNTINYIITTKTDGAINFYKHQNKNRKHFQHIVLPYQEIWESQKPKPKLQQPIRSNDLQLDHILLEPIDKSNAVVIPYKNEVYIIQNSNLYNLTSKGINKGLQLVYERFPYNYNYRYTIKTNEKKERLLVSFSNRMRQTQTLNLSTKELKAKRIYNKAFDNNPAILYTSENNIILTNKTDFWSIANDSKLYKLNGGASYHESLLKHQEAISNFRRQLRVDKINYNILKNVSGITIEYQDSEYFFIELSGFILDDSNLLAKNKSSYYYRTFENSIPFKAKTTLYLKRISGNPLSLIKLLKVKLNISLQDAQKLVANAPSILVSDYSIENAETLKQEIETLEAICYIKTDYFETTDGSTIHVKNGQFIFKSSLATIPMFYITAVLNFKIAMATHSEFAGNSYFLPVNNKLTTISLDSFKTKYINPFISHIITHEG